MRQTGGILAARDRVAVRDATVVSRLREAGAVIMATTNVPEGGMWMETYNLIHGRTNNPWNVAHTSGGSSGGEAALVAAGASPFGLGSDIGGSVRIPAAFCGVASHKPSTRMVPNTGHWGPENHGTGPFLTSGPICRSTSDLLMLLEIIAGPDGHDVHTQAWAIGDTDEVNLSDCTLFTIDDFGGLPYSVESMRARDRVVDCLQRRGAKTKAFEMAGLDNATAVWAKAMDEAADGGGEDSFSAVLGLGEPISLAAELARALIGRPRFTLEALAFVGLEKLTTLLPESLARKIPRAADLSAEVNEILGGRGLIVHPSYTRAAPKHRAALLTPFHAMTTAIWNVLGTPATQVPTGFASTGLPLGVQLISSIGNDHVSIAAAMAVEEDLGRLGNAPVR